MSSAFTVSGYAKGHPVHSLQQARATLFSQFQAGRVTAFLESHAALLDDYFCRMFALSSVGPQLNLASNPYTLVALGGYGRREQCVHSDVDLLFLFERHIPPQTEALIQEMVYPLWDAGLEVGHTTRSLADCLDLAETDLETFTAFLDARFVCGVSRLFSALQDSLKKRLAARGYQTAMIGRLIDTNMARHRQFGDSSYLLEPSLKEGRGGLRDYHTIRWIAAIQSRLKERRDLEYYGYISHDEYRELQAALAFIWFIRNHLHLMAGRKCDRLYFDYQTRLAQTLDYQEQNGQLPVERLLGELHGYMDYLKQQYLMFLFEQDRRQNRGPRRRTPRLPSAALKLHQGQLTFTSGEAILAQPAVLMDIFVQSARLQIPLASEAKRLVRDFLGLVTPALQSDSRVVRGFETVLLTPSPVVHALNEMLHTGFLTALIPEFGNIVSRIQYDEYHLYPVDKHSLRVVHSIKKFGTADDPVPDSPCARLYARLPQRKLLLWAALLHDIGKGTPGQGHSARGADMVIPLLTRMGLKRRAIETIAFLVAEHLFLIKVATRRDILEESTAIFCARQIKDVTRLKMLYLLTVADSLSTGPKAWSTWNASLLQDLFFKVLSILEKGELATRRAVNTVARKKSQILASAGQGPEQAALTRFFEVLSSRYLLYVPYPDILRHLELFRRLGDDLFEWEVTDQHDLQMRKLTLCARDRPGLFSKMAGVLTLNNMDILDAQIYTWRNAVALDVLHVKAPSDRLREDDQWARARTHLQQALTDRLNLAAELREKLATYGVSKPHSAARPPRIAVDNQSSSFYTIIEVFCYDFPGLLFLITDALFRCGLDIWVAKISTKVDQVVDVFYVRDFNGNKVDAPRQVADIQTTIAAVLKCEG